MSYTLVIIATAMFSLQFVLTQKYQQEKGGEIEATYALRIYAGLFSVVVAAITILVKLLNGTYNLNTGNIFFSWFTLLIALCYAVNVFLISYFTLKTFKSANLSVFSIFSMLGGMVIPSLTGILFFGETKNIGLKILCFFIILCALLMTFEKGRSDKKVYIHYLGVFITNGMAGVLAKIYTAHPGLACHCSTINNETGVMETVIVSEPYAAYGSLLVAVISFVILVFKNPEMLKMQFKPMSYIMGESVLNTIANLFLLTALTMGLSASVQYPLVTGGVIIFSTFVSLFQKNKITWKIWVSTALAFVSTIIIMMA